MTLPAHIKSAIDTYIPALGDWLDISRAYEMAELILVNKPDVCVELGTYKGQSLITQAFALRENNSGGKIYAIDPWCVEDAIEGSNDAENNEWWATKAKLNEAHQDCMNTIWAHQLQPWVVVIRSASQHCHQLFPHNIDWLYIDSNHSEEASCRDAQSYVPRVKKGGFVLFDDTGWPSTQRALQIVDTMCSPIKDGGHYRIYRKQ